MNDKVEYIRYKAKLLAIVTRRSLTLKESAFFSPSKSSLQLGIIKHGKGYREMPHTHKKIKRIIFNIEQFLFIRKGRGSIDFFINSKKIRSIYLKKGDTILILDGAHALNTFNNFEAITIKQGPFLGKKLDKEEVS